MGKRVRSKRVKLRRKSFKRKSFKRKSFKRKNTKRRRTARRKLMGGNFVDNLATGLCLAGNSGDNCFHKPKQTTALGNMF
jgi:hypothetical protein